MSIQPHPYSDFVANVQKPARYLGGEFGAICKDWSAPEILARVCLAFPDIYDIGMSHLGIKILYSFLNACPDILAERVFSPWIDMEHELRTRAVPLVSLESAHALCDFDVVGLSLQFELTYTNCLQILELGHIPLRACDRKDNDPCVVAGGPTATHPEPMAPFLDAVVIGDGEEAFPALIRTWVQGKQQGLSRAERLRSLASIKGVYIPSLYSIVHDAETQFWVVDKPEVPEAKLPIQRALVDDINRYPFPFDGPVPSAAAVFDRISIEIARGCTEGCRFCQAGMIYRPVRERDPESVIQSVTESLQRTGFDEVALTSLSTADYSCVSPLVRKVMQRLEKERVSLAVSSLRAYGLDEELLDEIQKVRATGLTFAPEAGTQRMRDVVNKNITEAQLMQTAERVFSRGWSKMKLYFMIGLPTERDEDVAGIIATGTKALEVGRQIQKGRGPKVTVSVSTHVPKPHTPFQWAALDTLSEIERKQKILRSEAKRTGVDLKTHDAQSAVLECILARGDRSVANAIEHAYKQGARFDSWDEQLNLARWQQAFQACEIDISHFTNTIPISARLPWSHIDVGLEEGFLAREYRKALKDQLSPPCGKAVGMYVHHTNAQESLSDARKLVCYDCGIACDLSAMRRERLVYLRKLGAHEPIAIAHTPRIPKSPDVRRPKASFVQQAPHYYRVRYQKVGPAAFLSHLDMVRALTRMLRRANIPLFYSQGFHPKPEFNFGPALPVGVASIAEYLDIKVAGTLDENQLEQLSHTLTSLASEGLTITQIRELSPNETSISKLLSESASTSYCVAIPRLYVKALKNMHSIDALNSKELSEVEFLEREIEGQLEGGSLIVMRTFDGIRKKINVRDYLQSVEMGMRDSVVHTMRQACIVGDFIFVEIQLKLSGSGGVRIGEVTEALFGKDTPYHAVRNGFQHSAASTTVGSKGIY